MDFITHISGDPSSNLTPLFLIHAISGLSMPYLHLQPLSRVNPYDGTISERPVYGINSPLYTTPDFQIPQTFQDLAELYVSELSKSQPRGPYLLGGWSLGGIVALKMGQILLDRGEVVPKIIMLDSPNPETFPPFQSDVEHEALTEATYNQSVAHKLAYVGADEDDDMATLTRKHIADSFLLYSNQAAATATSDDDFFLSSPPEEQKEGKKRKLDTHVVLIKCRTALRIGETVLLNRSAYMLGYMRDKLMNWDQNRFGVFEKMDFSGDHYGAFDEMFVDELSHIFRVILRDVD
ncbi:beta-ketoacyl synthase [Poronia punctata]|nr:beta-ketoacyl synthase [Poronia punctata]